jgi:hypothetical protein
VHPNQLFQQAYAFTVSGIAMPDNADWILKEARQAAPAPAAPRSLEAMLALPPKVDAYLKDHFGLRQKMIRLHKDLAKPLFFETNNVAIAGDSGRIYAIADDMVLQSAGRLLRRQRVADASDLIVTMRDALGKRGIGFLVALPPNSSSIYPDDLPKWARNPGRKTEYDLLLEMVEARGVKAVDLRPASVSLASMDPPTSSTTCTGMCAERSPVSTQLSKPTATQTGALIRRRRSARWLSVKGATLQDFSASPTASAKAPRLSHYPRREHQ